MSFKLLLAFLFAFLFPAAEGEGEGGGEGDGGGAPAGEGEGEGEGGEDDAASLDDLLGDPDPEPAPARETAQQRADRLERELAAERAARNNAPAPAAAARPAQSDDPDYEREEEQIRAAKASGANEDQLRWLKWQIDSNRSMRASNRTAQQALNEARDLGDRTEFGKLEVTQPKTFKRYAAKVEAAVADMRAKGQAPIPRMMILRLLIGDDTLSGKIKPKAKAAAAAAQNNGGSVPRGKMPGARSDVGARGNGSSEREKRRARLEGQSI